MGLSLRKQTILGRLHTQKLMINRNELKGVFGDSLSKHVMSGLLKM